MPIPAPTSAMQARPAPIIFAAATSMRKTPSGWRAIARLSMMFVQMQGFAEIDAGEDGEHIGLQERDQDFERGDGNDQEQRRDRKRPEPRFWRDERGAERDDEAREHLQHGVAGEH